MVEYDELGTIAKAYQPKNVVFIYYSHFSEVVGIDKLFEILGRNCWPLVLRVLGLSLL
jgi:hypothetical protein